MENSNFKRHSRQRDEILKVLSNTAAHPTAAQIYEEVKKEIPNISLGTVYRNLSELSESGVILKLKAGDGSERFDGCIKPHYHMHCKKCGAVIDLPVKYDDALDKSAEKLSGFKIDSHKLMFEGLCKNCEKE